MSEILPITFEVVAAEASNFTEAGYLTANPDIAVAVRNGKCRSGAWHFKRFGQSEGRKLRVPSGDLAAARRAKLQRIEPLLRNDMHHRIRDGKPDYLTQELSDRAGVFPVENISAHNYDETVNQLITDYRDGLVLDCGSGRRDAYYPNVVNFEIVDYDTTDVLGIGETLPFRDDSFDAVISVAVLEHVRDPIRCAEEICRVLKPGGKLYCAMPFLAPVHGYPDHYFNATPRGLKRLFEDYLETGEPVVTRAFHPIWALSWMLNAWSEGLSGAAREQFEAMTVADLQRNPLELLGLPSVSSLSPDKQRELACGSVLEARKPMSDGGHVKSADRMSFASRVRRIRAFNGLR